MRLVGSKHADKYLVVALEEVVQVVPLTDRAACMVQSMPAALLEVVFTPVHQPAHALYASSLTVATQFAEQFRLWYVRNKLACNWERLIGLVLAAAQFHSKVTWRFASFTQCMLSIQNGGNAV